MSVTASLVSGQSPQLVQVVVDEAPLGEQWELTGSTAAGYTWVVPGGRGVGDGGQLIRVDNRFPGNVAVTYRFSSESTVETAAPIIVPFAKDLVLQSLDGQRTVTVDLLKGSLELELPTNVSAYRVAGRSRPVLRYDVIGDVASTFRVLVPLAESSRFRELLAAGAPILYRVGVEIVDLDPVAVIGVMSVNSPIVHQARAMRVWELGYTIVDDPFADVPLGAFSWDVFDEALNGTSWDDGFDQTFETLTWDQFDTYDWGVLL